MKHLGITIILTLPNIVGCNSPDDRLSRLVRDTTSQQANQNQEFAKLNREAADNHRRVVEAVEQSRQEIVRLERDLHDQRNRIDDERRELAQDRYRDSLLAPVINTLGMLLVAGLPLVLCWCVLRGMYRTDDVISTTLVQELVSHGTISLPPAPSRPALAQQHDNLPAEQGPMPS